MLDEPHKAAPLSMPAQQEGCLPAGLEQRLAAIEAMVRKLQTRLDALQLFEEHRQAVLERYPLAMNERLAERVTVSAPGLIDCGNGFHGLEYAGDGRPFRWTGPGAWSRLTVWVDRTRPLRLSLTLVSLGRNAPDQPLEILVDGVPHVLTAADSPLSLVAGPIPARAKPGPTELALLSPQLFSPQAEGHADGRTLGLAVHELSLFPAE